MVKNEFNSILIDKILIFLVILFAIFAVIESRNHSNQKIANEIQSKITNEYNNIKLKGDKFVYFKKNLIFWTNNDIPLPKTFNSNLENDVIKLPNGYYILKNEKINDTIKLYVSLLKKEYSLNNSYLNNSFNSSLGLDDKDKINISYLKTNYNISLNKKTFCYLDFSKYTSESNSFISYILSVLYLLIVFVISKLLSKLVFNKTVINYWLKLFLLLFLYIAFYLILHFSHISSLIFNTDFFSEFNPKNNFLNSLGELFVFQIFVFIFISKLNLNIINEKLKILLQFLLIPVSWIYFYLIEFLLQCYKNVISLADFIKLDIPIFILLLQIMLSSYSLYIFVKKILFKADGSKKYYYNNFNLLLIAVISIVFLINSVSFFTIIILSITLSTLFIVINNEKIVKEKFSLILYTIILLILFSIINGIFIFNNNYHKEREFVEEALKNISKGEDKDAEKKLLQIEKSLFRDKQLLSNLEKKSDREVENYITNTYLSELNKTYSTEILICFENESLFIQPLGRYINSKEYLNNRILNSTKLKNSKSIYKENKGLTDRVYLGYFEIKRGKRNKILFIDCIKKKASKEMGYPDLLINEEVKNNTLNTDLDYYGIYQNNKLVLQVGNFNYPKSINYKTNSWNKANGFSHYVIKNNNNIWIASIKDQNLSDKLSIPSYLFIISSIFLVLLLIIVRPRMVFAIKEMTLSNSLQITLIGIFLISFVVFGSMSIKYFNKLNNNTNKDILIEKTQSICYSLEDFFENHKYGTDEIYYELVDLSNTFLTDINIFDTNGFLMNTSRPTVFSQGIISKYINPKALVELKTNTIPLIYQKERIGNRDYSATYMSILTNNGNTLGYLHIPYIIQQKNIEDKILEFVSAFINIYILWITLALILSILLSNFITQPLRQLQDKLKRVKLDKRNEKIQWSRQDELGNLILSYNSMVDKLEESTKMLIKEEREGAWREMAKQVAHEIKNPLTPMKLSIQQLQRLQNIDIVKFHERFHELSPALIEQINTLSEIASEFSDYAKDKVNLSEITDISECIRAAIEVFENQENITIKYIESKNKILVLGDKQQFIRIFNNLIKNAVQALYGKKDGKIEIELKEENQECKISIVDNGDGISKENQKKIFSSEFTTKVEGSGLGLSIVKSIIEIVGGRINFVSEENKGTKFNIYLPIWKP